MNNETQKEVCFECNKNTRVTIGISGEYYCPICTLQIFKYTQESLELAQRIIQQKQDEVNALNDRYLKLYESYMLLIDAQINDTQEIIALKSKKSKKIPK